MIFLKLYIHLKLSDKQYLKKTRNSFKYIIFIIPKIKYKSIIRLKKEVFAIRLMQTCPQNYVEKCIFLVSHKPKHRPCEKDNLCINGEYAV